jgi:exopolysaccharide biosynthesis protein
MLHKNLLLLVILSTSLILSSCATTASIKKTSEGIVYDRLISDKGTIIHTATIDLSKNKLVIHQAVNPNLKTVTQVAQDNNALVAINGGFFAKEGYGVGMLKVNGKLVSRPQKNRGVIGWSKSGEFFFDRLGPEKVARGLVSEFNNKPWWNEAENIIGGAPLLISHGKILSFESEGTLEPFIKNSYARTAVCVDKNQNFKFFVVNGGDSKTTELGGGMSVPELAQFLLEQNCLHALNLDGGYSSSFVLKGQRQNAFNIGYLPERKVANMLLILAQ